MTIIISIGALTDFYLVRLRSRKAKRQVDGKVTRLTDAAFCAVDVETTGLFIGSRLVEIGAIRLDQGGVSELQFLVDPLEPINPMATAIHGITDEMVVGFPPPQEAVALLLEFMGDAVFIAHNARFDVRIIGMELARAGFPQPDNHVVDTVLLARRLFRGLPDYRLDTLARFLGIDRSVAHRGLPDAAAAMEIFLRYLDDSAAGFFVSDIPGFLGRFSDLAPRIDVELTGAAADLVELAAKRIMVEIIYRGGTDPMIPRMITPISLYERASISYMRAYCHRTGMTKVFRVDRVVEVRVP